MENLTELQDLLIQQTEIVFSAELQLLNYLPSSVPGLTSLELKSAMEEIIALNKTALDELQNVMTDLDLEPTGLRDTVMTELLTSAAKTTSRSLDPEILDAATILMLQQILHHLIATYGAISNYAMVLDYRRSSEVLHYLLVEYKKADFRLTQLAEKGINEKAIMTGNISLGNLLP